jgi:hypothetical protein
MSAANISFFFLLQTQLKLYHWQTRNYARHVATDKVLGELLEHIDKYVEVYIGKYGRERLTKEQATTVVQNMTEAGIVKFVRAAVRHMEGPLVRGLKAADDSDLFSLRDDMVAELNQLLYLFTLK